MFSLQERLEGVARILEESNAELQSPKADATGFIPVQPRLLVETMLALLEHVDTTQTSLDLGCGNGGWVLLAAAAGFPSFGIEISTFMLDHCQRNYEAAVAAGFIDVATPCVFILGDMIPPLFSKKYDSFRKDHTENLRSMPIAAVVEDAYVRLPVSIKTADLIYCWSWPTQSRFLFNMLELEAAQKTIFILPSYERYTQGTYMQAMQEKNTLDLSAIAKVREVTIGRRTVC